MDQELYVYIVLLFIGTIIIIASRRTIVKKKPSLPMIGYKLIYSDQKQKNAADGVIYSKLLVSKKYMISGKPDFIYEKNGKYLPVELKSAELGASAGPRQGDLMQLVAYFLIIEDLYGARPKYGRLIYKNCMFRVKNTAALRRTLLGIAENMRNFLESGSGFKGSKPSTGFAKCRYCICRETVCDTGKRKKLMF